MSHRREPRVDVSWGSSLGPGHARLFLRQAIGDRQSARVADVSLRAVCERCGGPHGRPIAAIRGRSEVPDVSLSHPNGLVVAAISDAGPVGIDAERSSAADGLEPQVLLHPNESARSTDDLTRTWVRKEALLKATGQGLSVDPARVELSPPTEPPELIHWHADRPPPQPVWMADLDLGPNYVGCVVVLGPHRPVVMLSPADPAAVRPAATPRTTTPD